MTANNEQQFFDLAANGDFVEPAAVAAVFDKLEPVAPEKLIGKWKGSSFNTGHPTHQLLRDFKWAGKDFRSIDDVDPIMVEESGERKWFSEYGKARLREVKFRGVVSTAMIYDKFPVIDSFRVVNENVVMGAMDSKDMKTHGTYYFYLTRLGASNL